jgi:UDP-N-acetylmuramyl pentapeptide phosphotransferase/UDP-N-acetylglucosamine-1-phosphate transferase
MPVPSSPVPPSPVPIMPTTDQPNLFPSLDSIEPILWPGAALLVFVVTAVLVDVLVLIAARWRLVDMPNRRSAHALPTARGGGLAIVLMATLAALALVFRWPPATNQLLVGILLPCLAVAVLGVIDDIQPLNAVLRLFIHIAAATTVTAVLGPIREIALPGLPVLQLGPLGWPLTIVWIVGMTNAFNFMDGSDGMAGTGAVVGGVALALVGWQLRMHLPMMLAAFMAAAAGGFLVFNWQPARVFMGDVGSGFLGMLLAAIPLMFPEPQQSLVIVPAICCLWPYIFDPFVSVLRRLVDGENPLQPHREFFFHRLIRSGVSHAVAAMLYGGLAAAGGLVGWVLVNQAVPMGVRAAAPLAIVVLAVLLAWGVERRCRRVGLDLPGPNGGEAA